MTFRFCQLYILGECYGRIIHTEPLYQKKQAQIEQLKQGL
jgi:hypothetical protein